MPGPRQNAAFYAAPVAEFLAATDEEAYAPLAPEQLSAWRLQLPVLRMAIEELVASNTEPAASGVGTDPAPWIHLEFDIPRLGRRVDAVLVTSTCVIPIEFKVGAKKFEQLDYEQAWDYGLDLKNFHAPSHAARRAVRRRPHGVSLRQRPAGGGAAGGLGPRRHPRWISATSGRAARSSARGTCGSAAR